MQQEMLYEKLRVILGTWPNEIATGNAIGLPKHEVSSKLLTNLFNDKEARIVVDGFKQARVALSVEEISKLSGISKEELSTVFDDMWLKEKVIKSRSKYMMIPLYPGGFEVYFTCKSQEPPGHFVLSE